MEQMLGVSLDCSRNGVLKVEQVKWYAKTLKEMGYNALFLYLEDTYEIPSQPYFGHLRGRYSKDELKEIDRYCVEIGVEFMVQIQTLAHLEQMFKWYTEYYDVNDCGNILLIGEEKTYELIEDMISTIAECITSKKINIGMDEAFTLGAGKYYQKHGPYDRLEIMKQHLNRVCEITRKYGLEPIVAGDMFCKLAYNIENQYDEVDISKAKEVTGIPEDVSLIYWDYYSDDYDHYVKEIKKNQIFGRELYFMGGAWTWNGLSPANEMSMKRTKAAVQACLDCGIDKIIMSIWGDDGSECPAHTVLPTLMYTAEILKGNHDLDDIKAKFKKIVGCDFDSLMLLDMFDKPGGNLKGNPSKYLLYNDLFMGIRDSRISKGDNLRYMELAEKTHAVKEKECIFKETFESYEKLANVLSVKTELGIRTREAYLARDMETLKAILADYDVYMERLQEFHKAFQNMWFKYNKPHGFDVQDMRIGGAMQRALSCKNRLIALINGEINEIPELDEPVLEKANGLYFWDRIITPNAVIYP